MVFKQALTRSDTAHIKAASGISYLIFISIILFFIFYFLKKNNFSYNFFKNLNKKKTSVFCSEDNNIVNDSYKISKDQIIGIIPPIGGG